MSFLDRIRTAMAVPYVANGAVKHLSPYDDVNHLWDFRRAEWLPHQGFSREVAMQIPAVNRARRIICHTIAAAPLLAYRADTELESQPLWIERGDGAVSHYHRMLYTVDDLIFYGVSAWAVDRDSRGQVLAADRIPFDSWAINEDGQLLYTGRNGVQVIAPPDSVIVIPGSDEGLLTTGKAALGHAADLLRAATKATETPSAYLELHQTNDVPITDADRSRIIAAWQDARRGLNGGVAFTSAGIEVREHGAPVEHLLVEGRNAAALDVARAMGVPGQLIDATTPTASLNYETSEGRIAELVSFGLGAFMMPISARLSLDDMSPRGTRVAFDLAASLGPGASVGAPDDGGASTPATPPAVPETGATP